MEQFAPIAMDQLMLLEQQIQQTANVNSAVSIGSGYANYLSNSTTNNPNALINVLENVIIVDSPSQE